MARWRVRLEGNVLDLEDLPAHFTSPNLRVVEDAGGYFVESATFEGFVESTAVRDEAERLLPMINGAARLRSRSFHGIKVGAQIDEFGEDGPRQHAVVIAVTAEVRAKANAVIVKEGAEEPQPPPPGSSDEDKRLELASKDTDVAEDLDTWGSRPHDWVNLYKVLEIVQSRADVARTGWASHPVQVDGEPRAGRGQGGATRSARAADAS